MGTAEQGKDDSAAHEEGDKHLTGLDKNWKPIKKACIWKKTVVETLKNECFTAKH